MTGINVINVIKTKITNDWYQYTILEDYHVCFCLFVCVCVFVCVHACVSPDSSIKRERVTRPVRCMPELCNVMCCYFFLLLLMQCVIIIIILLSASVFLYNSTKWCLPLPRYFIEELKLTKTKKQKILCFGNFSGSASSSDTLSEHKHAKLKMCARI